jgi:hypothetical protein
MSLLNIRKFEDILLPCSPHPMVGCREFTVFGRNHESFRNKVEMFCSLRMLKSISTNIMAKIPKSYPVVGALKIIFTEAKQSSFMDVLVEIIT